MTDWSRMIPLVGEDGMDKLRRARVLVVGLGGVGGYCVEALARAGVGTIGLVDDDCVDPSNVNRQLYCLESTLGCKKVKVAAERVRAINPDARIDEYPIFVKADTLTSLPIGAYDVVADCIDTVTSKVLLAVTAARLGVTDISCMGSGNKLHAAFTVADLYETKGCPLARVMRQLCKKAGLNALTVVYSTDESVPTGQRTPSSISYVPAYAGLKCAETVLERLLNRQSDTAQSP